MAIAVLAKILKISMVEVEKLSFHVAFDLTKIFEIIDA